MLCITHISCLGSLALPPLQLQDACKSACCVVHFGIALYAAGARGCSDAFLDREDMAHHQ